MQGCSQGVFFTEALAKFQHVNCTIVQICEVKGVACYARGESFTEAAVSVASMVAMAERCFYEVKRHFHKNFSHMLSVIIDFCRHTMITSIWPLLKAKMLCMTN